MKISVQREEFDLSREVKALSGNPKIGAVASFIGQVRDVAMTLEHYPGMTEKALVAIVEQAKSRWQLIDCTVIHRFGELKPTDPIVQRFRWRADSAGVASVAGAGGRDV